MNYKFFSVPPTSVSEMTSTDSGNDTSSMGTSESSESTAKTDSTATVPNTTTAAPSSGQYNINLLYCFDIFLSN